jgi:hypothetical protein
VSAAGIGLVLDRRMLPGTFLELRLNRASARVPQTLFVEVTHATRQPDGPWFVGCTFLEPLSDGELEELVEMQAPPQDSHRS